MLTTTTLQFCGVVFGWTLYDVLFVVKTTVRISREVWHTRDSKREVRMRQYLDLLRDIRDNGEEKGDRTGTGTKSVFGRQVRYDLSEGFPAVTTKKLYFNSVVHELLWFLKGTGNIEYLAQNNVHIWDEWPFKAYLQKNDLPMPEVNSPEWREQMKGFVGRVATDHMFAQEWEISDRCMACSGANGRTVRVVKLTKSLRRLKRLRQILTLVATSSRRGILLRLTQLPKRAVCHRVTRCFS